MKAATTGPIEIFYSYSHKDQRLRDQLEIQLSLLKREGLISNWHDRKIVAGEEWEGQIDKHLNTAQIILLLVSPDFIASDYCYDVEMTRALERHEAGDAQVIPIILRRVDWKSAPFGKLKALPKDGKPVMNWKIRDEAFYDIAKSIRTIVKEITTSPKTVSNIKMPLATPLTTVMPERLAAEHPAEAEREIARDNQRDAALQAYIDNMSELILERNLRKSAEGDQVRSIARIRTLTVLPRLDEERKRRVLLFLQESGLIERGIRIIDLSEADLSKANLSEADLGQVDLFAVNLSGANLSGTYLSRAILSEANLSKATLYRANLSAAIIHDANLSGADLKYARLANADLHKAHLSRANFYKAELVNANLRETSLLATSFSAADLSAADLSYVHQPVDLTKDPPKGVGINFSEANLTGAKLIGAHLSNVYFSEANLSDTDLSGADLTGADFSDANLSGAHITIEQLNTVKSLQGAIMPDGSIHPW